MSAEAGWTRCTATCVQPTVDKNGIAPEDSDEAHCTVCHRTFISVEAFDHHRRDGRCRDPRRIRMIMSGGRWWFWTNDE